MRRFSSKAKFSKAKCTKSNESIHDYIRKLVYLTKRFSFRYQAKQSYSQFR